MAVYTNPYNDIEVSRIQDITVYMRKDVDLMTVQDKCNGQFIQLIRTEALALADAIKAHFNEEDK